MKPSWKDPMLMWICFLHLGYPRVTIKSVWQVVFWTVTICDSHKLRQFRKSCRRNFWFVAICDQGRDGTNWVQYYSTGVQIVSCTLSDDSVLSESTGLFNPVLCVSQWNLFWQKNQPMRLCLSNQVRSAREWFPSPLGDFIRLFEGLIGELFQIWHWNMFYFFKWHQSGP